MLKYVAKTDDGFLIGVIHGGTVHWRQAQLWELLDCGFTSEQIEGLAVDHVYRLAFTLIFDRAWQGGHAAA